MANHNQNFILYAEDDHNYSSLMECIFRQSGVPHTLRVVSNGAEVVAWLRGDGKYADRAHYPLPVLVMLDLKMPVMNGFEALDWIRNQSDKRQQPVVVLTSSDEIRDIKKAYELGANSFLVKPPNVDDLKSMMKTLENYWLHQNETPDRE